MSAMIIVDGKVKVYNGHEWVEAKTDVTDAMEKIDKLMYGFNEMKDDIFIGKMQEIFKEYNEKNGITPSFEDVNRDG